MDLGFDFAGSKRVFVTSCLNTRGRESGQHKDVMVVVVPWMRIYFELFTPKLDDVKIPCKLDDVKILDTWFEHCAQIWICMDFGAVATQPSYLHNDVWDTLNSFIYLRLVADLLNKTALDLVVVPSSTNVPMEYAVLWENLSKADTEELKFTSERWDKVLTKLQVLQPLRKNNLDDDKDDGTLNRIWISSQRSLWSFRNAELPNCQETWQDLFKRFNVLVRSTSGFEHIFSVPSLTTVVQENIYKVKSNFIVQ